MNNEITYIYNKAKQWAKRFKKENVDIPIYVYALLKEDTNILFALEIMNVDIDILSSMIEDHIKDSTSNKLFNPDAQQLDELFLYLLQYKNELTEIFMANAIDATVFKSAMKEVTQNTDSTLEIELEYANNAKPNINVNQALSVFCENLCVTAVDKPCIGRNTEIENIQKILMNKIKKNVLLLGDPGVGKTAIVEGLAYNIINKTCHPLFYDKIIMSLDINKLVAGTMLRGDLENRVYALIEELKKFNNVILFIDEAHTMSAGNDAGGLTLFNTLKPAMARGQITIILSTTQEEFERYISKDKAFTRRCNTILVKESSIDDTYEIIKKKIPSLESFHGVIYSDKAIRVALDFTDNFIYTTSFPDKAFDIIDELGSYGKFNPQLPKAFKSKLQQNIKKRKEIAKTGTYEAYENAPNFIKEFNHLNEFKPKYTIVEKDVYDYIFQKYNIVYPTPNTSEVKQLIKEKIVGQDTVIDEIITNIELSSLDFGDSLTKGNYIFLGNTGTGKSELAKLIAKYLFNDNLFIVDCSEYKDKYSIHRLIGSDPGFVGYEEGGSLIKFLKHHKQGVILWDEIEEAHHSLYDTIITLIGEGRITDGKSTTASAKNFMNIFTSNHGAESITPIGFNQLPISPNLEKLFKKKFLNRIDGTFVFNDLTQEHLSLIYDRLFDKFQNNMKSKLNKIITPNNELKKSIIEKSISSKWGARELIRNFNKLVKRHYL